MRNFSKFRFEPIIHHSLFFILVLGACLRLYGLNWDQGHHLHPDERAIVMAVEKLSLHNLNPKFFAYGNFPFYLLKAASFGAGYDLLPTIGRVLSGLFDLGTIFLIFKIGKKVFSRQTALWASFFYSVCVLPIQLSHFYAVDTILNFFILLTLYRSILFYEKQNFKRALAVGISFGLALATKISATALIVSIGAALLFDHVLIAIKGLRKIPDVNYTIVKLTKPFLRHSLAIFLSTVCAFLITEPYALLDFDTFWTQISQQHQMTRDAFTFPYTLQYVGTTPDLYHLKNLWFWGMGVGLGTLGLVGAVSYIVDLFRRICAKGEEDIEAKEIILVVFFLAYFLIVGRFAVKFMRYLLPLYPLLVLYAARLVESLRKPLKKFVRVTTVGLTLLWTLAFASIYSQPNTRVLATRWFQKNVPAGAKIAVEHWDDRVPLRGNYQFLEMTMYDPDDSEEKWERVGRNLSEADYLVLASNRLYVPLQRLQQTLSVCEEHNRCYPKTAEYYQKLFNEELGFKKVAEFTNYPKLSIFNFQFSINDDSADESFTVYDHPKVIVFRHD